MKNLFSRRELIKNSMILFSTGLIAQLLQFLLNLFLSNRLGPESFGILKTVLYFFTFLPALIGFGINFTLVKYVAEFNFTDKNKIGHLIKWFLKLRIISFIILITAVFAFRDFITSYFIKDIYLNYLIIPGLLLIVGSFFTIVNQIVIGYQNFKLYGLAQVLNIIFLFIFVILATNCGIYYILMVWPLSNFSLLVYWKFLSKKNIFNKIKKFDMKKVFWRFSMPMYLLSIPDTLQNFLVPLLSLFFSKLMIGYFSFAFMFYYASSLMHGSLASVLFPKVSELNGLKRHSHAKEILKKGLKFYTPLFIIGLIAILLFSEWFISLVDARYLPSLFMFQVIVSLGLLFGYVNIYNAYLRGLGKVKRTALLVLLQNAVLFAVSFLVLV
jgi:O-antigen/teichoic acid export membrane protein